MHELSDSELLIEYVERGNETAFCEIVTRHTDLIYSSALRQVTSPDLAQDVAQSVFTDLARKAKSLNRTMHGNPALLGWLYRSTRFAALNQLREDRRRRDREQASMEQFNGSPETERDWDSIRPALDEAMTELSNEDREALLLRFFKNLDFRAVGEALGVSDDAAQKRVSRAVDRLRKLFANRGVTIGVPGLTMALSSHVVQAVPLGLATLLSGSALANLTAASKTLTILKLMTMTKLKIGIVSTVAVAVVVTPLVIQHNSRARLRASNEAIRQNAEREANLRAENDRLANQLSEQQTGEQQAAALASLEAETKSPQPTNLPALRQETRRLQTAVAANAQQPTPEQQKDLEAKMAQGKNAVMAFAMNKAPSVDSENPSSCSTTIHLNRSAKFPTHRNLSSSNKRKRRLTVTDGRKFTDMVTVTSKSTVRPATILTSGKKNEWFRQRITRNDNDKIQALLHRAGRWRNCGNVLAEVFAQFQIGGESGIVATTG